jgi:hypothetical protein
MLFKPIHALCKAFSASGESQRRCLKRGSAQESRPMNVYDLEDFAEQAFVTPLEPEPTRKPGYAPLLTALILIL